LIAREIRQDSGAVSVKRRREFTELHRQHTNVKRVRKQQKLRVETLTERVSGLKIPSEFKGSYKARDSTIVKEGQEINVIESLGTLIGHES